MDDPLGPARAVVWGVVFSVPAWLAAWGVLLLGKVLTMDVLVLLLLLLGLLLFLLAAAGVGHPRVNLLALGLACWIATAVLAHPLVAG